MVSTQHLYVVDTAHVWYSLTSCKNILLAHVKVLCFVILGTGWHMFGDTLGMVWDGKQQIHNSRTIYDFQNCLGVLFLHGAAQINRVWPTYGLTKKQKRTLGFIIML